VVVKLPVLDAARMAADFVDQYGWCCWEGQSMYVTVGGAGIAAPFVLHGDPWVVPELTLDTVGLWMNLDAEVEVVDGVRSIAVQDVKTLGALIEHL